MVPRTCPGLLQFSILKIPPRRATASNATSPAAGHRWRALRRSRDLGCSRPPTLRSRFTALGIRSLPRRTYVSAHRTRDASARVSDSVSSTRGVRGMSGNGTYRDCSFLRPYGFAPGSRYIDPVSNNFGIAWCRPRAPGQLPRSSRRVRTTAPAVGPATDIKSRCAIARGSTIRWRPTSAAQHRVPREAAERRAAPTAARRGGRRPLLHRAGSRDRG